MWSYLVRGKPHVWYIHWRGATKGILFLKWKPKAKLLKGYKIQRSAKRYSKKYNRMDYIEKEKIYK